MKTKLSATYGLTAIQEHLFYCLIFSTGFGQKVMLLSLYAWILISLVAWVLMPKKRTISKIRMVFVMIPSFIVLFDLMFGLINGQFVDVLGFVERKMLLLLLPVVALIGSKGQYSQEKIYRSFIYAYFISSLYILIRLMVLIKYDDLLFAQLNTDFFNTLSSYLNEFKHKTYGGILIIFAFVASRMIPMTRFRSNMLKMSIVVSGLMMLALWQSKAFVVLLILLVVYDVSEQLIAKFIHHSKVGWGIVLMIFIAATIGLTSLLDFSDFFQKEDRVIIWQSVLGSSQDISLWGLGVVNVQSVLNEFYLKSGYIKGLQDNYNAHNQFLQSFLESGIPGVALLLAVLFGPLFLGSRSNRSFFLMIVLSFVWVFTIESFFNRFVGIFIFLVIYLISFYDHPIRKSLANKGIFVYKFSVLGSVALVSSLVLLNVSLPGLRGERVKTFATNKHSICNIRERYPALYKELNIKEGYQLDNTSEYVVEKLGTRSYHKLWSHVIVSECKFDAELSYFTSSDFNGEIIGITLLNQLTGKKVSTISKDIKNGKIHRLEISTSLGPGYYTLLAHFMDVNQNTFDNLNGNIVFVNPEVVISKK